MQLFPRFYFVNNDDLVEIIGNSNEPAKIIPHLGNMFAAITTIELNNPNTSEEGLFHQVRGADIYHYSSAVMEVFICKI
ncbi:MAG: hypothetical protein EBU49_03695 [Proteobacteria bacterium]|nr:hypothetical protein [Pseudomonadota bacterium]